MNTCLKAAVVLFGKGLKRNPGEVKIKRDAGFSGSTPWLRNNELKQQSSGRQREQTGAVQRAACFMTGIYINESTAFNKSKRRETPLSDSEKCSGWPISIYQVLNLVNPLNQKPTLLKLNHLLWWETADTIVRRSTFPKGPSTFIHQKM